MSVNPYAASTVTDVPDAPAPRGWMISDGMLLVEKEATLPMVDPYSGESEERMTLVQLDVRRRTWLPRLLFAGGLLGAIVASLVQEGGNLADWGLGLAFVGLITGLLIPLMSGRAWVQVFVSSATFQRNRVFRAIGRLGVALLVLLFLMTNLPIGGPRTAMILFGLFVIVLALSLLVPMFQRRIYHKGICKGGFRIGGIHPRALEALQAIQDRRSLS